MSRTYDPAQNSREGYQLALRAAREQCIRRRQILPEKGNATELRWASEGPRAPSELESVRQ